MVSRARCRRPSLSTRLKAGEIAYGTARTVEPFALFAERLAARPLHDVLGSDAVAGLAAGVVVVDLGVGRVPRSAAPQAGAGRLPHGIRGPAHYIRGPAHEPFVLVRSHALPPSLACRLFRTLLYRA